MYIPITALTSTDELWVGVDDYRYHVLGVDAVELKNRLTFDPHPIIERPVLVRKASECRARRRADLLWAGGTSLHVVSQAFIDALVEFGATGWETYPIDLVNGLGQEIPGYVGFLEEIGGAGDVRSPYDDRRCAFAIDVKPPLYDLLKTRKLRFKKDVVL
ncbi:hypothetical protein [Jonesia quinghaiensis]|uniref:hypothetical protein n=1 Tax=Jonesia quinghaiensis TaxID=262806 RepID=UPI0012FC40A5|nr:hypothetical protein [Jonesia quinghaiensis]